MSDSTTPSSRPVPVREDCWSQEASSTLIEAWGRRYVELKRGNLRQKDWQEVAALVNARHGHSKKSFRTDVQCKNRIDTIKKKYKAEKARVEIVGKSSEWLFYDRLDELIGPSNSSVKKHASGGTGGGVMVAVPERRSRSPPMALPLPNSYRTSTPMATAVVSKKRAAPAIAMDDSYFRKNYSAVAAAAAAAAAVSSSEEEDSEDDEVEVVEEEDEGVMEGCREKEESEDGIRKLAMAIRKFADVYAKVEAEKQKQVIEMEKQRIQFTKDLEVQRMQMYVNMQLQLKKIKIAKGNMSNGESN